jgi:restriction system protein
MPKISIDRMGEIMKVILTELKDAGGEARVKDLLDGAEGKLALTEYEKDTLERSGYVRWHTNVRFYSIDCVKAGYIQKSGGKWILTLQGEEALKKPAGEFMRSAMKKYRAWKSAQETEQDQTESVEDDAEPDKAIRQTAYEQGVEQARVEIEDHIRSLGPYDFQKLVAELLVGMGYHVPYVAPPGPDGGIDIVAYKDPLGTSTPRIRVQVKHREQKLSVREARDLEGLLRREGDVGLLVSSGGFTSEVERELGSSNKHMETMDLDRLIGLWQEHYDKIRESGKALLPLVRVFFLAPAEE